MDAERNGRRSRLYVFPGGVLEIEESEDQEPGTGVYLVHHSETPEGDNGYSPFDTSPETVARVLRALPEA